MNIPTFRLDKLPPPRNEIPYLLQQDWVGGQMWAKMGAMEA